MNTALHIDPATVPGTRPLVAAPGKYVVTGPDTYVHLPRSMAAGVGRAHVDLWCGMIAYPLKGRMRWADTIPEGRSVCGTCEGRRAGYWREHSLIFRPTRTFDDISRRTYCPGSREDLYRRLPNSRNNGAQCLLCGYVGRIICGGGPYNPHVSIQRHAPESPRALMVCPTHGYKQLRCVDVDEGRGVYCQSFGCEELVIDNPMVNA